MRHVDIVKNEWLAGYQLVVARAFVDAGAVVVDSPEASRWESVVLRPIVDRDKGEVLFPEKDPELFVEALPKAMHGTYLFATDPHEEAECSYAERHFVVTMDSPSISRNVISASGQDLATEQVRPAAKAKSGKVVSRKKRAKKTAKKTAKRVSSTKRIAAKRRGRG